MENSVKVKTLNETMLHTLFIILLLEGFITISVEILTIRQLIPFFGNSVLITSLIIGIFLLFLAIGYWRGGMVKSQYFKRLSYNFTLSLIWIGVGLSYSFISIYFHFSVVELKLAFLFSLFLYLIIVLAPIVYWLGQTIPLTTNLFNQERRVSSISGRALFISTVGSFLGAVLTSLILFHFFGVAWTILVNCALLFFLVIYIRPQSQLSWIFIIMMFIFIWLVKLLNVDVEKIQFVKTNNYANYEIKERGLDDRILSINNSLSSKLDQNRQAFPYIELIRELLFNQLNIQNQEMLIIGAGGFTLTANGTNNNDVTYLDIDPEIKTIAEKDFLHEPIQGQFIGQDARAYFNETNKKFDVIVADAYSNLSTIPASLLTVNYFKEIANHLNDKGVLIVNMINNPTFSDEYSQRAFNTIHAIFPYCTIFPVNLNLKSKLVNMIYICPKMKKNNGIYGDDLTTVTMDFFKSIHNNMG